MDDSQHHGKSVFGVLRRRGALIVLAVGVCVAAAALVTVIKQPTYQATALLVVDQRATSQSADLNATISTGEVLAAHYVKMASTATVLNEVCAKAGPSCTYGSLKDHVSVTTVKGTDLLAVSVADTDRSRATLLANLLAAQLISQQHSETASALAPTKTYLDAQIAGLRKQITDPTTDPAMLPVLENQFATVYASRESVAEQESRLDGGLAMVERARVPANPTDPDPRLYLPAGLAVGLVLGGILALLVDRIDDRIFSSSDLSEATGIALVADC
jgi:capsular polysaccharide biosynthesis protein